MSRFKFDGIHTHAFLSLSTFGHKGDVFVFCGCELRVQSRLK